MDSIISCCRQIFIVSILSNIVLHLVPSDKYDKYIKYICGIIMLAVCIEPILNILPSSLSLSEIYANIIQTSNIKKLENELKYQEANSDNIINEYTLKFKKDIENFVLEQGLYPINTEIVIDFDENSDDFGSITKIELTVSEEQYSNSDKVNDSTVSDVEKISIPKIDINNLENGNSRDNNVQDDSRVALLKQKLAEFYAIPQDRIVIYS